MAQLDDPEVRQELIDSFHDLAEEIEQTLNTLSDYPSDDVLNALFRAVHSVKGNAGLFALTAIVDLTHSLEEVAASLRSHHFHPTPTLCAAMLVGMDRIRDLHHRDLLGTVVPYFDIAALVRQFTELAEASQDDVDARAQVILDEGSARGAESGPASADAADTDTHSAAVLDRPDKPSPETGEYSAPYGSNLPPQAQGAIEADRADPAKIFADLNMFQMLALQQDRQFAHWEGRSIQIFEWAQTMNHIADSPVDYDQFAAAIYLHDIGMSLIRPEILVKAGRLDDAELAEIRRHPEMGHDLLQRIPDWDLAARIILQHQERYDGSGYPGGLKGDEIEPGARILAVIDAFFSMTQARADPSQRRSVLRAVAEISEQSGAQFDPAWVEVFHTMIKRSVQEKRL